MTARPPRPRTDPAPAPARPDVPVTPAAAGSRTGRSQAALAFGTRAPVFGRPGRDDGATTPEAADDRQVAAWGAATATTRTAPIALRGRRRRR